MKITAPEISHNVRWDPFPKKPPSTGPIVKPTQNMAPVRPRFFVLFSADEISATYACPIAIPAPPNPERNRPNIKTHIFPAKAKTIYPTILRTEVITRRCLRP